MLWLPCIFRSGAAGGTNAAVAACAACANGAAGAAGAGATLARAPAYIGEGGAQSTRAVVRVKEDGTRQFGQYLVHASAATFTYVLQRCSSLMMLLFPFVTSLHVKVEFL